MPREKNCRYWPGVLTVNAVPTYSRNTFSLRLTDRVSLRISQAICVTFSRLSPRGSTEQTLSVPVVAIQTLRPTLRLVESANIRRVECKNPPSVSREHGGWLHLRILILGVTIGVTIHDSFVFPLF